MTAKQFRAVLKRVLGKQYRPRMNLATVWSKRNPRRPK